MSTALIGGAKGGGGSTPRAPVVQPDTLRSVSIVEVVDALHEGEGEGWATADPLESIYLDGTPLKSGGNLNFAGVSVQYRHGTQSQSYMPGSIDNTSSTVVSVAADVTQAAPVIRSITDSTTDAVRVTLKFNGLFRIDSETNDRVGVTVTVQIDVRLDGGAWLPADLAGRNVIHGKTESPYERSYHINLKAFGEATTYDVRVSRVTADQGDNEFSNFQWHLYSKLSYAKLRYPNTAVVRTTFDARSFDRPPSRGFMRKGIKVKVPGPSVYNPVARVYTGGDWDGNDFVTAWTRNPAWIFYDIVTNPRYGLGEQINPVYQDKWTLYQIAKICDQMVDDGKGGEEHRYSLDLYLQAPKSARDVLKDVASSFDAMPYWGNSSILLTQDAPKVVSELYAPGNVANGQFTYVGAARQTRYTVCLVQWNDPDDQYRIATEYVEDPEGIARYGYRELPIAAIGCTSRGQAHRHGMRILLTGRLEPEVVNFGVGLEGLKSQLGNVCRIADPLRAQGKRFGGRVKAGSTAETILLDAPVILASGIGYKLAVITAGNAVIESLIVSAAGIHSSVIVSPPLAAAPEPDLTWIIYNPAESQQTWRVIGITENENTENGFYSITATRYDGSKYDLIDSTEALPPLPDNPFINNSVVPPSGLLVQEGVYLSLEGLRRYIDLSWSASTDRFLRGYRLVYRHNGRVLFDGEIDGQSYRVNNPHVGDWEFTLSAVTVFGKFSTSITVEYELGQMYPVESVSVTGLKSIGAGSELRQFKGKSCELDWDTDALTVLGYSDTYAVGQGGQSPWFRDYQVDIWTGLNPEATLLRTDFVTESAYVYTYEKNQEDGGPRRIFAVRVRARDYFGRYSQAQFLDFSNPAPPAISVIHIYSGLASLIIQYTRPIDNDLAGAVVFLSTTSGFTPAPENLAYAGPDATITIGGLLEDTPYFIRVGVYDAFGGETEYTLTGTEHTKTISSIPVLTPTDIKNKLQEALDDPENDALIFDTDAFAIRIDGGEKTPFMLGMVNDAAAILMDADVYITSTLSASQIVGGRIAATEDIIIGDGSAIISGDGSIKVYQGADTEVNRDYAILSGGTLSFQRYRGGEYREYKSVRRIEEGEAASGSTVFIPGYWDSIPKIITVPNSLGSYNALQSQSSQKWAIRHQNLREITPGSGQWQFDAVAELNYANAAGSTVVSSSSGATSSNSYTSGDSVLPVNAASVTVSAKFSSIRGDGISTHGYFYRSVSWWVQGWNGGAWVDIVGKTLNLTAANHGQLITDTQSCNVVGYSKIRTRYSAFDTNGTKYSRGSNSYNYAQNSVAVSPVTGNFLGTFGSYQSLSSTATLPAYSPPVGWEVYAAKYIANWDISISGDRGGAYVDGKIKAAGVNVVSKVLYADYNAPDQTVINTGTYDTGQIPATAYNRNYWAISLATGFDNSTYRQVSVTPTSTTIFIRQLQRNSATAQNNFTFQAYAWNITGSTAIAFGSLNWWAIGD